MSDPITPNMGLDKPVPGGDLGVWGTSLNSNADAIDAHDHTIGKGVQVPSGGINHNATENYGNVNGIEGLDHLTFNPSAPDVGDNDCSLGFETGEFVIYDGGGNRVQMSSNGAPASPKVTIDNVGATSPTLTAFGVGEVVVEVDSTTLVRTVTLPLASTCPGCKIVIVDSKGQAATHNITVQRQGGDTISGATSKVINSAWGFVRAFSDGAQWLVL